MSSLATPTPSKPDGSRRSVRGKVSGASTLNECMNERMNECWLRSGEAGSGAHRLGGNHTLSLNIVQDASLLSTLPHCWLAKTHRVSSLKDSKLQEILYCKSSLAGDVCGDNGGASFNLESEEFLGSHRLSPSVKTPLRIRATNLARNYHIT